MPARLVLITILGIMAVALCACGLGGPDTSTPENLAKVVVDSIKDNDFKKFKGYCIDKDVLLYIIEQSSWSDEKKKRSHKEMEEFLPKLSEMIRDSFDRIKESAEKDGVDLAGIKYLNATYKKRMDDNVETVDMNIIIEAGNSKYKIRIGVCVKSEKGWRIANDPRWKGKVE